MGLFGNGGWFNDLTSTVNPFDDKNGAFQGSGGRVPLQTASPGPDLSGAGQHTTPGAPPPDPNAVTIPVVAGPAPEPAKTGNPYIDMMAGAYAAATPDAPVATLIDPNASAPGYWGDYGNRATNDLMAQSTQYQGALNSTADQSAAAGAASADALNQTAGNLAATGQSAAQTGLGAQSQLGELGSYYGGQSEQAGNQYAGQLAAQGSNYANALYGTGGAAQSYATQAATQGGRTAGILQNAGQNMLGQAGDAQGRNISQAQQNALMGIEGQAGPSAAQGQLALATNQNQANALAMARSGRGFGGSASAMRQAAAQRAGIQQNAANQSAMLTAQEDAARRQRMAQNFGTAGQLATSQAGLNDAYQQALNQQGLGAIQAGGQQQLASSQLGLSGYGQNLAAQQAAAQTGLGALGQAANTQLAGLGQAAQTNIGAHQAGAGLALQGYGQQAQAQQGAGGLQQAAGQQQLAGLGQAGNLYGNAATYGMNNLTAQGNVEQQGLGWQQQQTQNQLTAAGINNGVALQQQAMGNQMMGAYVGALGSVIPMAASALSDRNAKEGIEPTNVTLDPSKGSVGAGGESLVIPVAGTAKPIEQTGNPYDPATYDPFSQGVGISGPNQAQGSSSAQAATSAAASAAGSPSKAADAASTNGQAGAKPGQLNQELLKNAQAKGGLGNLFGSAISQAGTAQLGNIAINPVTGQPWQGTPNFNPYAAPMAQGFGGMQPITSDEREKEAVRAFEETPGYSYNYKDPEAMGATDGRQYGLMAQDLEKTPAGRSVVHKGPDGTKMVDTSRLALVEGAAINGLLKRIEALEGKRGKKAA